MNSVEDLIKNTLLYSSLFNSPLKKNELYRRLQTNKKISQKLFENSLNILLKTKKILLKKQYLFLKSNKINYQNKDQSIQKNFEKIILLNNNLKKILPIPFIKAIYLTGSLAVLGSSNDEDFDLLIVTEDNRLWITRFLVLLKSQILGLRRFPHKNNIKNKFCFNVFLEENAQKIESKNQNLFISYEIIQARPLYLSKDYKNNLITQNLWIKKFIYNSVERNLNYYHKALEKDYNFKLNPKTNISPKINFPFLNKINYLLYKLQKFYMKSKITNENIKYKQTFFHPNNISIPILNRFELAKKQIS